MMLAPLAAIALCAAMLAGIADEALGQTVYRCGPAGNAYSSQPCPDGRPIDVGDPRSAAQVADARTAAADSRRLAAAMARERVAAERAAPPRQAGAIGPLPPAPTGSDRPPLRGKKTAKAADGPGFVAVVPGSGKAAKKKKEKSAGAAPA